MQHSTVNKSEDTAARADQGPNADIHGVFNDTHANTEGMSHLDRTKEHAQGSMMKSYNQATGAQGPAGGVGPSGPTSHT